MACAIAEADAVLADADRTERKRKRKCGPGVEDVELEVAARIAAVKQRRRGK